MLSFDPDQVRANVRQATTEDLLDRATVYRDGMEPKALEIIDDELRRRGVGPRDLDAHEETRRGVLLGPDGSAEKCSFCRQPAVERAWGMHYLFGKLPIFPRRLHYCKEHQPSAREPEA